MANKSIMKPIKAFVKHDDLVHIPGMHRNKWACLLCTLIRAPRWRCRIPKTLLPVSVAKSERLSSSERPCLKK